MEGQDLTKSHAAPADTGSAPDLESALQPSYLRGLFLAPDGLRSGWGFAFYVAVFYPLQFLAARWVGSLNLGANGLWATLLLEFTLFVAAIIPAFGLSWIEKRPFGAYGLPARQAFSKWFWLGAAWGFISITVLLSLMYGVHLFRLESLALHGVRIVKFAAFWAVFFLLVGFFEEFLLRGYTQFTLTRAIGFWPAALLLSGLFGLMHLQNAGEQWRGLLAAAAIGLFFSLTLHRTGTLWFAVGFHAAWDWGETFFYSVPDSGTLFPGHLMKSSFHGPNWLTGGMVGPEGSALCFLVIGIVSVAFAAAYPQVRYTIRSPGESFAED